MATRPVKLKLLPRSVMKAKVATRLVGQVEAGNGITVVKAAGNFTVSVNAGAGIFQLADADLTALAALSGTGIARRTGAGAWSVGTTVSIAEGGTGQVTAAAGFDALAPTTTRGDIIFRNATTNTRLAAGTSGYALIATGAGADPAWTGFTQSGTGAVVRTWLSKAQDVLHGTDFGIVADGVTDNATALLNLEAKAVATQKKIVLPPGIIHSTASLTLTGSLTIEGAGSQLTTLSFATGVDGIITGEFTLEARNLKITTNATAIRIGTALATNFFSVVENVYCFSPAIGIEVINGAVTRILNSQINGYTSAGITISSPLNPDGGDCLIDGCWILANGGVAGGASQAAIFHTSGGGWKIVNNKMVGGNRGYWHRADYATVCSSVIISGNSIEGMAQQGIAFSNLSSTVGDLYNVIVADNQGGSDGAFVYMEATGSRTWMHIVDIDPGNVRCSNGVTAALSIDGAEGLIVSGGTVGNVGTGATAVVIGSLAEGQVDLPEITDYTTRYTNAAGANVRVTDIRGNLTIVGNFTTAAAASLPAIVQGDLWYGSAAGVISALAKNTTATRYLANTGTSNNPAWAQVDLSNGVTGDLPFANLTQGSALSVLGVTGNATADNASIAAGSDHQVLRRSGTAVAFGALNLAQSAAVTGALGTANGGFGADVSAQTGVAYMTAGTASFFDPAPITASLGADVDLNNTANYFTGPSIAQGSTGTWWVSGQVTVLDTASATTFFAKLWDGTTVIASGSFSTNGANFAGVIALSGRIASPAGDLRISVRDIAFTTGKIKFNATGESKDSTITAVRVK